MSGSSGIVYQLAGRTRPFATSVALVKLSGADYNSTLLREKAAEKGPNSANDGIARYRIFLLGLLVLHNR
jgi:hypothetical protein